MANENNEYRLDYTAEQINEMLGMVTDMTETNTKLGEILEGVTETSGKVDALSTSMGGNMATIISKLDTLLKGFRVESGVYPADADLKTSVIIPCTNGAKILVVVASKDDADAEGKTTYDKILASSGTQYFVGAVGQSLIQLPSGPSQMANNWSYMSTMQELSGVWKPNNTSTMILDKDGGTLLGIPTMKAGKYNWTAYYWDEPEQE